MRQQLSIPKLTSQPAGPGPSFLVDLAPEMRNSVYDYLLEFASPIAIRYLPNHPHVLAISEDDDRISEAEDDDSVSETESPDRVAPASKREVQAILGILGTCRQLYHETASILYGRNTFVFGGDRKQHIDIHGHIPFAAGFLTNSSTRSQCLQRVVIDLDRHWCSTEGCRHPHPQPKEHVDLTPLVKASWMLNDTNCIFEFKSSELGPGYFDVEFLHLVLRHLVADTFHLRKYGRQILAIKAGNFIPQHWHKAYRGQKCIVVLGNAANGTRPDACMELQLASKDRFETFKLLRDGLHGWRELGVAPRNRGKTLELISNGWRPNLLGLPSAIQTKIYQQVLIAPNGIMVDLDTKRVTSVDTALLFVNKAVFKIAKPLFWTQNTFTYKMKMYSGSKNSGTPSNTEAMVHSLQSVLCYTSPAAHFDFIFHWSSRHFDNDLLHKPITIDLHFEFEGTAKLSDIRLNVIDLLRVTSHIDGNKCFFRFIVTPKVDEMSSTEQNVVPLYAIRARLLEYLIQLVRRGKWPGWGKQFPISIDGYGEVPRRAPSNVKSASGLITFESFEEFPRLPSVEAIEAKYGTLASKAPATASYNGTMNPLLNYLQDVVKKCQEPETRAHRDDFYAKKWFRTRRV